MELYTLYSVPQNYKIFSEAHSKGFHTCTQLKYSGIKFAIFFGLIQQLIESKSSMMNYQICCSRIFKLLNEFVHIKVLFENLKTFKEKEKILQGVDCGQLEIEIYYLAERVFGDGDEGIYKFSQKFNCKVRVFEEDRKERLYDSCKYGEAVVVTILNLKLGGSINNFYLLFRSEELESKERSVNPLKKTGAIKSVIKCCAKLFHENYLKQLFEYYTQISVSDSEKNDLKSLFSILTPNKIPQPVPILLPSSPFASRPESPVSLIIYSSSPLIPQWPEVNPQDPTIIKSVQHTFNSSPKPSPKCTKPVQNTFNSSPKPSPKYIRPQSNFNSSSKPSPRRISPDNILYNSSPKSINSSNTEKKPSKPGDLLSKSQMNIKYIPREGYGSVPRMPKLIRPTNIVYHLPSALENSEFERVENKVYEGRGMEKNRREDLENEEWINKSSRSSVQSRGSGIANQYVQNIPEQKKKLTPINQLNHNNERQLRYLEMPLNKKTDIVMGSSDKQQAKGFNSYLNGSIRNSVPVSGYQLPYIKSGKEEIFQPSSEPKSYSFQQPSFDFYNSGPDFSFNFHQVSEYSDPYNSVPAPKIDYPEFKKDSNFINCTRCLQVNQTEIWRLPCGCINCVDCLRVAYVQTQCPKCFLSLQSQDFLYISEIFKQSY